MEYKLLNDVEFVYIVTKEGKVIGGTDTTQWDALPQYKRAFGFIRRYKRRYIMCKPFKITNVSRDS